VSKISSFIHPLVFTAGLMRCVCMLTFGWQRQQTLAAGNSNQQQIDKQRRLLNCRTTVTAVMFN